VKVAEPVTFGTMTLGRRTTTGRPVRYDQSRTAVSAWRAMLPAALARHGSSRAVQEFIDLTAAR
jgi:hypothetical protein